MEIFKNISIKKKLLLFIISIFLLSISSAAIYSAISLLNSSKKVSANIAEIINESYSDKITNELENSIKNFNNSVNNINVESIDGQFKIADDNLEYLKRYLENNKDVKNFFFVPLNVFKNKNAKNNKKNKLKNTILLTNFKNSYIAEEFNYMDFEIAFEKLIEKKSNKYIHLSAPFFINHSNKDEMFITITKLMFFNKNIIGFAGVNLSISKISKIINTASLYNKNAKLILISENKDIIFASEKTWLSGKNISKIHIQEKDLLKAFQKAKSGTLTINNKVGSLKTIKLENTNLNWSILTAIPYNVLIKELISNIYMSIIIASLIMVLGLFIVVFFINKSFKAFDDLLLASKKIEKGESVKIPIKNKNDEFEKIINSFNKISDNLNEAADISSKIVNGNYDIRIKQKSEKDLLSASINKIAENLKAAKEKSVSYNQETFKQLWMRRGRFEVSEAERKSENNINELTFNILKVIVNYTDAILGGLYLYDDKTKIITLTASYAYEKRKHSTKTFKLGEGLVGACLLEKKRILLNDVPDDYIKISSGLGSGKPSNISIIPIFYQGKINSVIELGFLKQPEEYVIEFIERLGDNVGSWIDAAIINSKTVELLKISGEQTQKLAEKELELNNKVEELQKIQAETIQQNVEFKSLVNAVNNTVMTVEYTLEGILLNSNETYEKTMGYTTEDIKGINVMDLVRDKDQKDDLSTIIKQVAKGQSIKRQIKRFTKNGEEKWLSATYTPYFDKDEKITKILFFAHDITKMKTELDNLKKKF